MAWDCDGMACAPDSTPDISPAMSTAANVSDSVRTEVTVSWMRASFIIPACSS